MEVLNMTPAGSLGKRRRGDDFPEFDMDLQQMPKKPRLPIFHRLSQPSPGLQLPSPHPLTSMTAMLPRKFALKPAPLLIKETLTPPVTEISNDMLMSSPAFSDASSRHDSLVTTPELQSSSVEVSPKSTGRIATPRFGPGRYDAFPLSGGSNASSFESRMLSPLCTNKLMAFPLFQRRNYLDVDRCLPSPITEDTAGTPRSATFPTSNTFIRPFGVILDEDNEMVDAPMTPLSPYVSKPAPRWTSPSRDTCTEKRRFQVGFREDCEKCRLGVPGHITHIVPVSRN